MGHVLAPHLPEQVLTQVSSENARGGRSGRQAGGPEIISGSLNPICRIITGSLHSGDPKSGSETTGVCHLLVVQWTAGKTTRFRFVIASLNSLQLLLTMI